MSKLNDLSEAETIERYNRPWLFYGLSTVGTWAPWLLAAKLSKEADAAYYQSMLVTLLLLVGLLAPFFVSWMMTRNDPVLRNDFITRIRRFGRTEFRYAVFGSVVMLLSILIAQAISLLFGYSADQFRFNFSASFSAGLISGWMALIIAPVIEELSWHCYGTDTLKRRFNLLLTSLIFGAYWILWHAPLGFIEGYYQSNVVESGPLFTANMIISIFPFVVIMNWCYFKSNRSVVVAIIFHLCAGVFNEIFNTDPMSKVIQTVLLIMLCIALFLHDPDFFLSKNIKPVNDEESNTSKGA